MSLDRGSSEVRHPAGTERETIAEGVAFVVCTAIGLDAGGYAFPYIAGYAGQKDGAAIITRLMDTIQKTAAQIIEVIETGLLGEGTDGEAIEEVSRTSAARLAA